MIKTLSPYPNTSKTAEIMSRYRPIAPKPEVPAALSSMSSESSSPKISQSPYLRNLWPQLQARPTRTRKRGRTAIAPPSFKRARMTTSTETTTHVLCRQGFAPVGLPQLPVSAISAINGSFEIPASASANLVTLPLLPCPTASELNCTEPCGEKKTIDLNTLAETTEEKDLFLQLQGPGPTGPSPTNVIAPQPVRPVGSSIRVGSISEDPSLTPPVLHVPKKPEEVEEEVESEALPAVISDSNNKVRLANSAYKELVGQPECSWLDSMVTAGEGRSGGGSRKRIGGEVMLHLSDSRVPISSKGFSCWVRIEWGREGKKSSINAYCDVNRLSCECKDYVFTWRFHTSTCREEASQFSSNA